MITDDAKRGHLELTQETYEELRPYIKTMPQTGRKTQYYASLPIGKRNAQSDILVTPDGASINLCL